MYSDFPIRTKGKAFARKGVLVILVVLFVSGSVCAEEAASGTELSTASQQQAGLQWIDWLLIGVYACATIGLGIYFSHRQSSTDEYFVGGGNLNPFLVGISLFATLLSTISYLSMPGEASGKGPVSLVGLLALPLVFFVVAFGFLPVYMRQRVTSAYQLLEERLGLSVRLLGATMFLALRLVWMTLLVYLAAKAMTVMIGVDFWVIHFSIDAIRFGETAKPDAGDELRVAAVPVIVLFTGLVSVIYTTLGGLRAVVVTDFMQTCLLFGGALLVLATVTWEFGGFGWFPTTWHENWDAQPFFSFDPKTRVTVVGTILTMGTWYIATSGGDQTSVQRFMATRNATSARRALATQLCVAAVIGLTLYFVGFALIGYFERNPGQLPADMSLKKDSDDLFPRFIAYQLPVGVSGLVVAAMFAAAMSSIDSGVNSITAVVMTDYLDRFGLKPKTERVHVLLARFLALSIGVTVVFGSAFMGYIEGNITEVTHKTVNLLTTPIFALFFFAVFVPFARPLGVWIGALFGTLTAAVIAFSGPLVYFLYVHYDIDPAAFGVELTTKTDKATGDQWMTAEDPISFQWIGPVALLVNIAVGTAVSWLLSRISSKPKNTAKESGEK